MKKKIDSPFRKLRILLILPLVAMLFYAFATPDYQYKDDNSGIASDGKAINVKGQVIKSDGAPLYGTSVILRGSTIGTIADPEGKFELKDVPSDGELVFSFVGFKTVVRKITNQPMKIVMEVGKVGIDQVTVVGYGTPPPPLDLDLTKELEGPNPPLVFLDGVPITKEALSQVKPEQIESIGVLKGKSAIAVYGEKAKNGVVLIITKEKAGKTNGSGPDNSAQKVESKQRQDEVFVVVEEMPEFPGGEKALKEFIGRTVKYPADAIKENIQGKVFVTFTVKSDGTVGDAKIARGVNPLLDNEALRVVNLLPVWKPGKQRGQDVNVAYTIPVQFALDGGKTKQSVSNVEPKTNEKGEKEVFVVVEEMPEFPGGAIALRNFIAKVIKYPEDAKKEKIQGKVFVSFVVSNEGKVGLAKIERSVNPALDAEAMRVIGIMPDWKPGKQRGQAVSVTYTIPIEFKLQ